MQEIASKTLQSMQGISEDPNVPTLDSVREKIEGRYANALGAQELAESSQAGRMAEIETSTRDAAADMCLAEIRVQMNNESAALESGSAAKDSAGELESVEPAEFAEAVEDTTTDADEAK